VNFKASRETLGAPLEVDSITTEERLTSPDALLAMHAGFVRDDADLSANRAAVQELMDFVAPYDDADLVARGQGDRFNINYGIATSLRNEAIGPFLDLYTAPTNLVKLGLASDVDPDMASTYADIMADEWTKMYRSWDVATSNMLQLVTIFITQGVAIPWFEDTRTLISQVASLEDCKFAPNAEAVPSKIEAMTIERVMTIPELFAKIEGFETNPDHNGWNGPEAKRLIESAKPSTTTLEPWNYEKLARLIKSCRVGNAHGLPSIELVWGVIRELDGTLSIYATSKSLNQPEGDNPEPVWLYRKRSAYKDANQMFQIFPFSVGSKNLIYTIRGLGYALFEPGQADNILRCKMMDAARHRASEIYQPESSVDSVEDLQFIDVGHAMIAPKGLRSLQQTNMMRMDQNIGFALESNRQVLDKHSSGLGSSPISDNPSARRTEMQVSAEVEHSSKMQGFALSLFMGPYDKYMRELVRRSFTETQDDLVIAEMVRVMKEACVARGVPLEILSKIDLKATQATRLMGAGSKGSRLIGFQQMGELYASMDPQGQEFFNFDYAAEIKGTEAATRYFGVPGQRRGHVDIALARLENFDLLAGKMLDPVDGENKMIHIQEHILELTSGIEAVNQGQLDLTDWTMRNIVLYKHCGETLEQTTVHESRIHELNSFRQQLQQAGELIDNGLRHINKLREEEVQKAQAAQQAGGQDPNQLAPQPSDPQQASGQMQPGQPGQPGQGGPLQDPGQADHDLHMAKIFGEAQAKISALQEMSRAKQAILHQESTAKIAVMDAQTAAEIRRKDILGGLGS